MLMRKVGIALRKMQLLRLGNLSSTTSIYFVCCRTHWSKSEHTCPSKSEYACVHLPIVHTADVVHHTICRRYVTEMWTRYEVHAYPSLALHLHLSCAVHALHDRWRHTEHIE